MNGLSDASPAPAGTPPGEGPAPTDGPAPTASAQPAPPRLALFRMDGRLCGITAAFCKQFVQLEAVTPVPLAPAHLLGVTQLRGRILPVLDPSLLPGLPPLPPVSLPLPEPPEAISLDGPDSTPSRFDGRPRPAPPLPPAAGGIQALVVTATGLDSALAALKVTEIVGFERPALPSIGAAGSPAAARPLWRGEEVAVLDVAVLVAALRPSPPGAPTGPGAAAAGSRGKESQEP
jgi:hypothetical protein